MWSYQLDSWLLSRSNRTIGLSRREMSHEMAFSITAYETPCAHWATRTHSLSRANPTTPAWKHRHSRACSLGVGRAKLNARATRLLTTLLGWPPSNRHGPLTRHAPRPHIGLVTCLDTLKRCEQQCRASDADWAGLQAAETEQDPIGATTSSVECVPL